MENLNLLTVAVSSSALFDLTESDSIYQHDGLEAYRRYQIQHEEQVLEPGEGFLLVKKLLSLNDQLGDSPVEVIYCHATPRILVCGYLTRLKRIS